ncbi:DUF7453 family protein, partial [Streptobacillus moniliformis]|uniref:DUF7453 family protein n=1 Tax=Streptobacillus moniliformis TaxID=34105 RepID=UPI003F682AB1
MKLIAREGEEPRSAAGARFATFESLSIIPGRGPVFVAELASGRSKVKPSADRGCWAVAEDGTLRLLFREGDRIGGKILQSFSLLSAVPRSSA